jgi:hypothetical protein
MIKVVPAALHFPSWRSIDQIIPSASKGSNYPKESVLRLPALVGDPKKDLLVLLHGYASFLVEHSRLLDISNYTVHVNIIEKDFGRVIYLMSGSLFAWKLYIVSQAQEGTDQDNRIVANRVYDSFVRGHGEDMFDGFRRAAQSDGTFTLEERK